MTELERYQPPTEPSHVDSWVNVLGQVGDLAQKIAGTDFVPDGMRGKPAAVAAAILTGREMGVPPMKSLAHVFIVKGKPGLSAELMRSLILAAGHEFRFVETTNTRCIMEGRRRGSEEWERVSFTADQMSSSTTKPLKPSEQMRNTSSPWTGTVRTSGTTVGLVPTARVNWLRKGDRRASSGVICPAATRSATNEWSVVSRSMPSAVRRYARVSPT